MTLMQYEIREVDELSHHGITGQRWGIRRFQNKDGSLTDEGRKRYGYTGVGSFKESFPAFTKWGVKAKEKTSEIKESHKQKKAERKEIKHNKLVESGRPEDIKKHINELSADELDTVQKRFAKEIAVRDQISKIANSDKPVPDTKAKDPSKAVTDATQFLRANTTNLDVSVTKAKNFYNTVTMINNSLRKNSSGTRGLTAGQSGYMKPIS